MAEQTPRHMRNRLLAGLDEAAFARLAPELEPVDLPLRTVLETTGEPIEHVHFPTSGLASIVVGGPNGKRIEAGLFGRDGMTALPVVLGSDRASHDAFMQVAGAGHRIASDALREAMEAEPAIQARFLRYVQASAVQIAHTALANGQQTIESRLARWLLMCHDRVDGDVVALTHEFLSLMLGVRRAGVTMALHMIEGRGLIKATRGQVRILDRANLEAAADGSYGVPEAEYARLLGGGPARA